MEKIQYQPLQEERDLGDYHKRQVIQQRIFYLILFFVIMSFFFYAFVVLWICIISYNGIIVVKEADGYAIDIMDDMDSIADALQGISDLIQTMPIWTRL